MIRSTFIKVCFTLVAVFMFSNAAFATSIGIFSMASVADRSDVSQAMQKELQSSFGKTVESLEKEAADLQKRAADLQKQAAALSEKARVEKAQELEKAGRAFEEKRTALAEKMGPRQQAMQKEIVEILRLACENCAKSKKLDLILDSTSSVAYASPSVDVTQDILDEVNKIWKSRGSKFK